MRIIFYGTPDFAVATLDKIKAMDHDLVAVVTAPDKPAGRGRKLKASPVKEYALKNNIPVLQPTNLKAASFQQELQQLRPDLQVVVAFRMMPESVWALPPHGTFNIHASLLPQYRGAAPINYAIINGEKESGVTSFILQKEIDTGNIIDFKKVAIEPDDTAGDLHDKLMACGAKLAVETIQKIDQGNLTPIPQDQLIQDPKTLKTAHKIFKDDCKIDWTQPIDRIYNLIRGLSPYPTAYTYFIDNEGIKKSVKIFSAKKEYSTNAYETKSLLSDEQNYIKVVCPDGIISIEELQIQGKKRMDTKSFLRGFKMDGKWAVA